MRQLTYILPDKVLENKNERICSIRNGIEHIFIEVCEAIPEHDIVVTWNDDTDSINYESETVSKETIAGLLYKLHGTYL